MDWSHPVFFARIEKLRLIWNSGIQINSAELCFTKSEIQSDFSVSLNKKDFQNSSFVMNNRFALLYENQYYFPKGRYSFELFEKNLDLIFLLKGKNYEFENQLKEGKLEFQIPTSGDYRFFILTEKPIDFQFRSINIRKVESSEKNPGNDE